MFSLLQNRHPLTILLLIPLAVIFAFGHFLNAADAVDLVLVNFQKTFTFSKLELGIAYAAVSALNAIILSVIFNRLNLIDYFSQIVGLLYLIFTFSSVHLDQMHLLFADMFLIFAVGFLMEIKNNDDAKRSVFNASFFLGISILFNVTNLPLVLLPFFVLSRTKSFVFREYLLILIGLTTVFVYFWFYHFYYQLKFKNPFVFLSKLELLDFYILGALTIVVLLILTSLATRSRTVGSPGIRIERIVKLLFSGLVIQVLCFVGFYLLTVDTMLQVSVFLALYVGYVYHQAKVKFLYHFLSYAFIVLSLMKYFELFDF